LATLQVGHEDGNGSFKNVFLTGNEENIHEQINKFETQCIL